MIGVAEHRAGKPAAGPSGLDRRWPGLQPAPRRTSLALSAPQLRVALAVLLAVWAAQQGRCSTVDTVLQGTEYSGEPILDRLVSEVVCANESIHIAIYRLTYWPLAVALARAMDRGVDVKGVFEGGSWEDTPEYLRNKLTQGDEKRYLLDGVSPLMHIKFMVIDGRKTVVTTAPWTSSRKAACLIAITDGTVAEIFEERFRQMWTGGKNAFKRVRYDSPEAAAFRLQGPLPVGPTEVGVQFAPRPSHGSGRGLPESALGTMAQELLRARKSIHGSPYFFTAQYLADALLTVRRQSPDVDIRIACDNDQILGVRSGGRRTYTSEALDLLGVGTATSEGPDRDSDLRNNPWPAGLALPLGNVTHFPLDWSVSGSRTMLHCQYCVIDAETVFVGTVNWSHAGNAKNQEVLLILRDPVIATAFENHFSSVVAASAPIFKTEQDRRDFQADLEAGRPSTRR